MWIESEQRESAAHPSSRPWSLEGGPDLRHDDDLRARIHSALTDPGLTKSFRRRFPFSRRADYEEMIRALDYVWDCRHDGAVNVTGFCCAVCGLGQADAAG
jgi:hypothetical protein